MLPKGNLVRPTHSRAGRLKGDKIGRGQDRVSKKLIPALPARVGVPNFENFISGKLYLRLLPPKHKLFLSEFAAL